MKPATLPSHRDILAGLAIGAILVAAAFLYLGSPADAKGQGVGPASPFVTLEGPSPDPWVRFEVAGEGAESPLVRWSSVEALTPVTYRGGPVNGSTMIRTARGDAVFVHRPPAEVLAAALDALRPALLGSDPAPVVVVDGGAMPKPAGAPGGTGAE